MFSTFKTTLPHMINERTLFKFIYLFGVLIPSPAVDLTYIVLTDLCPSLLPTFFLCHSFLMQSRNAHPLAPTTTFLTFPLSGKLFS